MYLEGRGVSNDYAEAERWIRLAADQGHPNALALLGEMYSKGRGAPQDYVEALKWHRLAAEQGDPLGQFNLGVAYAEGHGVSQDYVYAYVWSNLAASGSSGRRRNIAVYNREIYASKLSASQIADAQQLIREWKPKNWAELKDSQ
jgi:TPR repeat protein